MRGSLAFALVLIASACSPAASSPSPSPSVASATPSPAATAAATPTIAPSPTPSPTKSPIPQPTFVVVSAPTADVVWTMVGGTRLFRSTDRGTTWQERDLPDTPLVSQGDLAFVNEREGWMTAVGPPATQCQSQSVAVWHTSDGAATWARIYQSDFTTDTMCKGGLAFADAQRGWLTLTSTSAAPRFSRTTDGGKTWARTATLPDPPEFTTQEGGFTLRPARVRVFGTTLLVSASGQTQTAGATYAFRSTDDGATWKYVSTAPQGFGAILFITASRWIQLLDAPNTMETTDAGATWHPLVTDYGQAAPVAPEVVFADASVGYATVRGSIQRTSDGGAHWSAIKTPGT
jgi:photosystem II stability/assembly factor-like uncharacterized protein